MYRKAYLHVLSYYALFEYPPTENEIYTTFPIKISRKEFKDRQAILERNKIITVNQGSTKARIVRNGDESFFISFQKKQVNVKRTLYRARAVTKVLSIIPTIQSIYLTGSTAQRNNSQHSDIDFLIVSSPHTLWKTRFLVLLIKKLIVFFRPSPELCFNLFFEEGNLKLPENKWNEYTAREILQAEKLYSKKDAKTYLLSENKWITKLFPNVQLNGSVKKDISYRSVNPIERVIEKVASKIQKRWLKSKMVKYRLYKGQAWLIQEDFEQHIRANLHLKEL